MTQEEIRRAQFLALKKSEAEKAKQIEYFKTHCLVCGREWNETKCGMVLLKKFGNIGICVECADKSEMGLPLEATERFEEASRLFGGAIAWKCNNGRLWIFDQPIPNELKTEAMQLIDSYEY